MDVLTNFSISGIYALLLLNLTFNFLLAIRINQITSRFSVSEESVNSKIATLNEALINVEDSLK